MSLPPVLLRSFCVRYGECDVYGHVNNTNYLRYVQEAVWDARTAAGYGPQRCAELGLRWATRRADIEFLRPCRYGDRLEARLWAEGGDGYVMRWRAELWLADAGEPAVRGWSEAALVEAESEQAIRLPSELLTASGVAGSPALPPVEAFPVAPAPPPGVFKIRNQVAWRDVDPTGQLHDAAYLVYADDCGMGVVAAHGWPPARMAEHGFAILLRRHQIEYMGAAAFGDELEIATWASNVRRASATRHYTVTRVRDGRLLARLHTLGVWVDLRTGRPMRIPDGFMADFAGNVVGETS